MFIAFLSSLEFTQQSKDFVYPFHKLFSVLNTASGTLQAFNKYWMERRRKSRKKRREKWKGMQEKYKNFYQVQNELGFRKILKI